MKRRFSSLRYRIALTVFFLEAIMVAAVLIVTLSYAQRQSIEHINKTDEVTLNLVAYQGRIALFSVEYDELQQYTQRLVDDPHVNHIIITDSNDRIVIATKFNLVGQKVPILKDNFPNYWKQQHIEGLGTVFIEFNNADLTARTKTTRNLGIAIALVGMLITALAGLLIGFILTRRLRILNKAVNQYREGDIPINTRFTGHDEVAQLGHRFAEMTSQLDGYIASLEQSRKTLEEKVDARTQELEVLNRQLEHLSVTDELTGLSNRRSFNEQINHEIILACRAHLELGLALIDIDHFKAYNDFYGHQSGDKVLKQIAQTIKHHLPRGSDFVARYGGEEFALIMSATNPAGCMNLCQNLVEAIENLNIVNKGVSDVSLVTISIGVTCTSNPARLDPAILIQEADAALYAAKEAGRDQVKFYQADATKPLPQTE